MKHRQGKPWWSVLLTDLWSKLCTAEKKWLSCTVRSLKHIFKADYVKLRKHFDREVQKAKRTYWFNLQNKLLEDCEIDQNNFWKSIGKIGVNNSKKKLIPEQVVLDNGTVSSSISDVLNKWKHDFSSLFNNRNVQDLSDVDSDNINFGNESNNPFNNDISIAEVKKAIWKAKCGKAYGLMRYPLKYFLIIHPLLFYICCSIYVLIMELYHQFGVNVSSILSPSLLR